MDEHRRVSLHVLYVIRQEACISTPFSIIDTNDEAYETIKAGKEGIEQIGHGKKRFSTSNPPLKE